MNQLESSLIEHIATFLQPRDFYAYRAADKEKSQMPLDICWPIVTNDELCLAVYAHAYPTMRWMLTLTQPDTDTFTAAIIARNSDAILLFYPTTDKETANQLMVAGGFIDEIEHLIGSHQWNPTYIDLLDIVDTQQPPLTKLRIGGAMGYHSNAMTRIWPAWDLLEYVKSMPPNDVIASRIFIYRQFDTIIEFYQRWPTIFEAAIREYRHIPIDIMNKIQEKLPNQAPFVSMLKSHYEHIWETTTKLDDDLETLIHMHACGFASDKPLRTFLPYALDIENPKFVKLLIVYGMPVRREDARDTKYPAVMYELDQAYRDSNGWKWLILLLGILILTIACIKLIPQKGNNGSQADYREEINFING